MDVVVVRLPAWWVYLLALRGFRPAGTRKGPRRHDGHAGPAGRTRKQRARKNGPAVDPVRKRSGRSQAQCGARADSIARLVVGASAAAADGKRVGSWTKRPPV